MSLFVVLSTNKRVRFDVFIKLEKLVTKKKDIEQVEKVITEGHYILCSFETETNLTQGGLQLEPSS